MFKKALDKSRLSLPESKTICGCEVKKMPIGAYLTAMDRLNTLPDDFIASCFPGKSLQDILDGLAELDTNGLLDIAARLFTSAPTYIIGFVSDLTGIPEEQLLNDENIGLDGFVDIVTAFIEVNRLGESVNGVLALKKRISELTASVKPTLNTGSST